MSINQLTMFKLWGDFDENRDAMRPVAFKQSAENGEIIVPLDENRDAMRPVAFKQSAEKKEIDSII